MDFSAQSKIQEHCRADGRYSQEAFLFIFEALNHTIRKFGLEEKQGIERHVTAHQLLKGAREYALSTFGPLSTVVFKQIGVSSTDDIGELVYLLITMGLLQRLPSDRREDFQNGFSFETAFSFEESFSFEALKGDVVEEVE